MSWRKKKNKKTKPRVPIVSQGVKNPSMRMRVGYLASLSRLRIQCCHKLWHRSQMRLGFSVAMAVA